MKTMRERKRRETATATATSFREMGLEEDEDWGRMREEMLAGNVAREEVDGGGGGGGGGEW